MSHITTIKTKIKDLDVLTQALNDLQINHAYQQWHWFANDMDKAMGRASSVTNELTAYLPNAMIVFRKDASGFYEMLAQSDERGLDYAHQQAQDLMQKIMQRYAYNKIKTEAQKRGLTIVTEERLQDDSLRLVVRAWR